MVRFIEYERLELDGRKITLQIRNVKWGTVIEEGKPPLSRFSRKAFGKNEVRYNIQGIQVTSIDFPDLECDEEEVVFYLQGFEKAMDNRTVSCQFPFVTTAQEVYKILLSMATNQAEIILNEQQKDIDELYLGRDTHKTVYVDDKIRTESIWEKHGIMPQLEYEKIKGSFGGNARTVGDNKWIDELMHKERAENLMRMSMGMGGSIGSNGWWSYSITGGINEEKAEVKNKTKGDSMKIVKRENLTVAQAVEKFKLDKAYSKWTAENSSEIGYYDSKETRDFEAIEGTNVIKTTEYNVETQVETTYFIENAEEFIQKLNALKPFDKMVLLEKYAEKPKFALGDKVIYRGTDVPMDSCTSDFPEELKKQILEKRIKNTEQTGIITQVKYDESYKIRYDVLTTKYGGITARADQLSKVAE